MSPILKFSHQHPQIVTNITVTCSKSEPCEKWLSEPYAKEHIFDNITSYDLICGLGPTVCDETESTGTESRLFYWILVGEVIMGFGFSGFMTLGMSYLHDISPPEQRAYNQGELEAKKSQVIKNVNTLVSRVFVFRTEFRRSLNNESSI